MNNMNDVFFRSSEPVGKEYDELLSEVQAHCTASYAKEISAQASEEAEQFLRGVIKQFLQNKKYEVDGLSTDDLTAKLYEDMAGYSFLRKWIYMEGVEEVNINAWNDIEVIFQSGRSQKIPEKFSSPQQAIDVARRMLSSCGMIIDDTMPSVLGHLDKNIRISIDKTPLVDPEVGINASIRIINQQSVSKEKLLTSGSATAEMLDFLVSCVRYGISVCIAGATGSGKTTVMAWLLSNVPNNYRLITTEDGSREFNLVKRDEEGNILNSVIHLLTRPHENPKMSINQDFLLERILRKHPTVIGMGEIRAAAEAMSVAEASRTGHTCVTTLHSNSCASSYQRMMTLAKREFDVASPLLLQIMVEAFPIVVYTKQLEDGSRKIMEIIEGENYMNEQLVYRTLYRYEVEENRRKTKKRHVSDNCLQHKIDKPTTESYQEVEETVSVEVIGHHRKQQNMSETLRRRFMDNGISAKELRRFEGKDGEK